MVRVILVAFAMVFVAATKVSAGQMEDVVYLENGGLQDLSVDFTYNEAATV